MMNQIRVVVKTEIGFKSNEGYIEKVVGGYKLVKQIGAGQFGVVTIGLKNGEQFAVKTYNLFDLYFKPGYDKLLSLIESEIVLLQKMQHPNIMPIKECFRTNDNIYLVCKLYKDGDLLNYIGKKGFLKEQQATRLLLQTVEALKYAANMQIMHRDIKLENLFLDGDNIVVGDFGLAKLLSGGRTFTVLGTPAMMAPEVVLGEGYGFKADVWSLGITFYMSIFQTDPWGNHSYSKNPQTGEWKLRRGMWNTTAVLPQNCGSGLYFPSEPAISNRLKLVLQRMIEYNPATRATLNEVVQLLTQQTPAIRHIYISNSEDSKQSEYYPMPSLGGSLDSAIQIVAKESPVESEVVRMVTFDKRPMLSKLSESSVIIEHFFVDNRKPLSVVAEMLLSNGGGAVNSPAPSHISHQLLPDINPQEAEEKFLEQYLQFNLTICEFFFDGCYQIQQALLPNSVYLLLRGPLAMACNLIAKKIVQIAGYFIMKLSQTSPVFTEINKKYEFYQNGFAKQYLQRFEDILEEALRLGALTEADTINSLPQSYYRRDAHLAIAANHNRFTPVEEEALTLAIFYLYFGLNKYMNDFPKEHMDQAKHLVVSLKAIYCYRDVMIFKAEADQYQEFFDTVQSLRDPCNLERQFQTDKEYFRKWKDSLKTN